MKLVVLGATGGTGLEIVRQALEQGHSVTALVRSPEKLKAFRDRITIQQGDPLDSGQLERVIAGHDAVVSGFGPRVPIAKEEEHLLQQFAAVLTSAMQRAGVKRLVIESVAFLFKNSIVPPAYLLGRLLFPGVVADSSAMERIVAGSDLHWTTVRPPQLTDTPFAGKYRARVGRLPAFGFKISRADVAHFMVKAAGDRSLISKVVGVSN